MRTKRNSRLYVRWTVSSLRFSNCEIKYSKSSGTLFDQSQIDSQQSIDVTAIGNIHVVRCAETHRGRFRLIRCLHRAYRFSEYSSSIAYSPVETRNGIIALRMRVRKSALILFSFEASPLLTYFDFCLRMNIEAFRTGDGRSLSS